MPTALRVALEFIHLAERAEEPDPLTHLRLQKLLYYAQGWSLAHRNRAMFSDRIEAWAHGPVVPAVYHHFKPHGAGPLALEPDDQEHWSVLDDDDAEYIEQVWDAYKAYSALKLRSMTHDEPPWRNARKGYSPADLCNEEITQTAMRDYFASLAAAK